MISSLEGLTKDRKAKVIARMGTLFNRTGKMPVRWTYTELKRFSDYIDRNSHGWSIGYYQSVVAPFNRLELDLMRAISQADDDDRMQIQREVKALNQTTKREIELIERELYEEDGKNDKKH